MITVAQRAALVKIIDAAEQAVASLRFAGYELTALFLSQAVAEVRRAFEII